jgi:uncharacterized membrane protein YsdA (DUF1294 family)
MALTQLVVGVLGYLALINLAAFLVFAWDKRCAQNGMWRVPERTLLGLAAIGGSPAMIAGQYALRHKTWKEPFRTVLRAIAAAQIIGVIALSFPQVREAIGNLIGRF